MTTGINRAAFRYYGGKSKLAAWIISFFPEHNSYVEPCAGAASVLLQKERSPLETLNDLDGGVVNFFRMLRERREELVDQIRYTPWARAEYRLSYQPTDDPLEWARRFYMRAQMGIGAEPGQVSGMRMVKRTSDGIPAKYHANIDHLYAISERLMGVQIEEGSAFKCIERYETPETLFYFDPPYVLEERVSGKAYVFEVDKGFHIEAATLLRRSAGYVVVSGYASDLYVDLYEVHGWRRVDIQAQTNGMKKVESVWLNPRTVEALERERVPNPQMILFEAEP